MNLNQISIADSVELGFEVLIKINELSTRCELARPMNSITGGLHPVLWLKRVGRDILTTDEKECLNYWITNRKFKSNLMPCSLRLSKMGLLTDRSYLIIKELLT